MIYEHILDNQQRTVADYLNVQLTKAETFQLVSACFTIYGYELLADALDSIQDVPFLFGDTTSVDDLDPGNQEPKSFEPTEDGLVPNHALHQKYLARRCAEWVNRDTVAVRSVSRSNFLHGKMYLTAGPRQATGLVGSSNFTRSGLGIGGQANLEINLAATDTAILAELQNWFGQLWNNEMLTHDVKPQVLNALRGLAGIMVRNRSTTRPSTICFAVLLIPVVHQDIHHRRQVHPGSTGYGEVLRRVMAISSCWELFPFYINLLSSTVCKVERRSGVFRPWSTAWPRPVRGAATGVSGCRSGTATSKKGRRPSRGHCGRKPGHRRMWGGSWHTKPTGGGAGGRPCRRRCAASTSQLKSPSRAGVGWARAGSDHGRWSGPPEAPALPETCLPPASGAETRSEAWRAPDWDRH